MKQAELQIFKNGYSYIAAFSEQEALNELKNVYDIAEWCAHTVTQEPAFNYDRYKQETTELFDLIYKRGGGVYYYSCEPQDKNLFNSWGEK